MQRTPSTRPSASKTNRLDLIDRKILCALMRDGRLTNSELAAKVGLSASSCWTRVRRLETDGAIERYVAIERLYRIEGVRHTRSTFSLRALKWSTSIDPLLLGER